MLLIFEISSDFDYLNMSKRKEFDSFAIDSFDYEYMICFRARSYYKCCGFCKLMVFINGLIL